MGDVLVSSRDEQLDLVEWLLVAGYLHTDLTCAELVDLYREHRAVPDTTPAADTLPVDVGRR